MTVSLKKLNKQKIAQSYLTWQLQNGTLRLLHLNPDKAKKPKRVEKDTSQALPHRATTDLSRPIPPTPEADGTYKANTVTPPPPLRTGQNAGPPHPDRDGRMTCSGRTTREAQGRGPPHRPPPLIHAVRSPRNAFIDPLF